MKRSRIEMSFAGTMWTVATGSILMVSLFILYNDTSVFPRQEDYPTTDSVKRSEIHVENPELLYGMPVDHLRISKDVVGKNQRFSDLLGDNFIPVRVRQQVMSLPQKTFDFRRIIAGSTYTLMIEQDSLHSVNALVYEPNLTDYVIFHLKDSLYVENCQHEVTTLEKTVAGEIQSSLSETIEELGISHDLTNKFVDIFGWQVDFQRLQKGDKFKLIYEETQVENKPTGIGRIKGIYFEHSGALDYAFAFDQGEGWDYFNEEGQSLRKALLKYPIEFTSISSRYNLHRFHPIARVFRAHLGTDFAAPAGTPIRSVGDGVVAEAQYNGGNGNYVKVRHNDQYTTAYLHMSKIAGGIAPGARIKKGQTIGFVGSTGWATGPHVCYRLWKNGAQVDPLKVELPPSLPVRKEHTEEFHEVTKGLIKRLQGIRFPPSNQGVVAAS